MMVCLREHLSRFEAVRNKSGYAVLVDMRLDDIYCPSCRRAAFLAMCCSVGEDTPVLKNGFAEIWWRLQEELLHRGVPVVDLVLLGL